MLLLCGSRIEMDKDPELEDLREHASLQNQAISL